MNDNDDMNIDVSDGGEDGDDGVDGDWDGDGGEEETEEDAWRLVSIFADRKRRITQCREVIPYDVGDDAYDDDPDGCNDDNTDDGDEDDDALVMMMVTIMMVVMMMVKRRPLLSRVNEATWCCWPISLPSTPWC